MFYSTGLFIVVRCSRSFGFDANFLRSATRSVFFGWLLCLKFTLIFGLAKLVPDKQKKTLVSNHLFNFMAEWTVLAALARLNESRWKQKTRFGLFLLQHSEPSIGRQWRSSSMMVTTTLARQPQTLWCFRLAFAHTSDHWRWSRSTAFSRWFFVCAFVAVINRILNWTFFESRFTTFLFSAVCARIRHFSAFQQSSSASEVTFIQLSLQCTQIRDKLTIFFIFYFFFSSGGLQQSFKMQSAEQDKLPKGKQEKSKEISGKRWIARSESFNRTLFNVNVMDQS